MSRTPPNPVHAILEVRARPSADLSHLRSLATTHLSQHSFLSAGPFPSLPHLHPDILSATLHLFPHTHHTVPYWRVCVKTCIYVCVEDRAESCDDGDVEIGAEDMEVEQLEQLADVIGLPSVRLEGVWERLEYGAGGVKERLVGYVGTGWELQRRGVDWRIVGWNGVVLLHGPPGTGKTSLCRGLLQKMSVWYAGGRGVLVEVKMERLLSKWFSESGERVGRLFEGVRELAGGVGGGVVGVLLDEVEGVGMRREGRIGNEPGDGIRVVNSLLGGVDSLRGVGNVVVVCTSNLMEGIDRALMDRVDVRMWVGLPGIEARCAILASVVSELVLRGVVKGRQLEQDVERKELNEVGRECEGMSGRRLRKVGILALASLGLRAVEQPVEWATFLRAMRRVAVEMAADTTESTAPVDEEGGKKAAGEGGKALLALSM